MTWYSSEMPLPPSMSRATRAMLSALPQLLRLIMEIISGAALRASLRRPTCRAACRPRVISVDMSASLSCTIWFLARGLPNCLRSMVYWRATSMQAWAAPIAPKAMPKRALLRQLNGPVRPLTLGSMFSAGTLTSSIKIMPVLEARRENLPSIVGAERPGMSFSRMKPRMSPSSSLAHTTKTSASGELVIQFLEPLRMKLPSACLRARDSMLEGSLPWLGSVRPKQPILRPEASSGRYFFFCSSEPQSLMGPMTRLDCTDMAER
mmetsp:Transcript_526/g.1579  ORF Transcript_526/g.1579 Transcript_526/m.1579 type:complete len:264 (+) Transcript_526:1980-2771(+)